MPSASQTLIANIASEHRKKIRDQSRIDDLRRQLREEQLAEHIKRVVDQAPPLTAEQKARLAALLTEAA